MGLAERRAAKRFQDESYPKLKTAIDEAAGFETSLEVDWSSLAIDDSSHLYDECFPKVYFQPLIDAFAAICIDDMGKEALAEGLKQIVIKNEGGRSNPRDFTFDGGVLTIDHKPTTNVDNVKERAEAIQKILEKGL